MQEKRAHTRALMHVEATIADATGEAWRPIVVLDISSLGIAFACAQIMESGTSHMLRFCLPGNEQRHDVIVSIVHSSTAGVPSGYRVGAKFAAASVETKEAIAAFISHSAQA